MDEAVRARASAKGWLTRTEKKLKDALDKYERNKETVSKTELTVLLDQFSEKLRVFENAQNAVECYMTDTTELEHDIDIAADYRDDMMSTYIKVKELLESLTNVNFNNEDTGTARSGNQPVNARLPKIELASFSGDVTQWRTFWDQYSAIIQESNQPDVTKFTYLRSFLKDEALRCVDGLSLTAENYQSAITILQQRFGRTECIIFGHIQKLLSLASKSTGKTDLWSLYDLIQTHVRSLENLGNDGKQYGVVLTPLVLHQLPNNIRLEWAREGEGHEGDLDFLLSFFLFTEIRRRERSQTFASTLAGTVKETESRRQHGRQSRSTAATLFTAQSRKRCAVCDGEHYPADKCLTIKELSVDKRKDIIKRKGLCFVCLGNHLSKDCKRKCYSCKGHHHLVICPKHVSHENGEGPVSTVEQETAHVGMTYINSEGKHTLMQVVKSEINGEKINVIFDSGADRSFITSACAAKLKLNVIGNENVTFSCFAEDKPTRQREKRKVYRLNAFNRSLHLLEVPTVCCKLYRCAVPPTVLSDFDNLPFEEDFCADREIGIDILIGLDLYWDLIDIERVKSKGLVAQKTTFGWTLSGQYHCNSDIAKLNKSRTHLLLCHCEISEDAIRHLWDLDCIGIKDARVDEINHDFNKILRNFNETVVFEKDRYKVSLPWKSDTLKDKLMDNKEEANKRLENLEKKLNKDPELKNRYISTLSDLEKAGIICEVPKGEIDIHRPVFYLLHRPVIREDSLTTKIRPVFDASAKGKNEVSLNHCMEIGPNMIPDLLQVLLGFRRWRFGLSADITKAFLQIKLNKDDQDVHRFLWNVNDQTRVMRFERVTFGNACSPFLLNATVKHHLSLLDQTRTVTELKENLYVDDFLTGADTENEIMSMIWEAQDVMLKGGFPVTKWTSNCLNVNQATDRAINDYAEMPCQKILGVSWNTTTDTFCFETMAIRDLPKTKRKVLSLIARTFDPIRLLTLKILFQEIWKLGLDWDQFVPKDMQTLTEIWVQGLKEIQNWTIPRCMATQLWTEAEEIDIIAFSDSSEKAYRCCIYLQMGRAEIPSLIMSKVRVAPLKKLTIPRLELMAAVMMARLHYKR